ncbi:MAG TPA: VWA domain-containing protein [Bryobacteraceae bacterium]|nr:VWA domain-containing protein [Bryobacteraceae bacterium]
MLRFPSVAGWLTILLALAAFGATAQKPFVDCTPGELVGAVPQLAGVQFDASQESLDGLLRATGENLAKMYATFADISAAEQINELRFNDDMGAMNRSEAFRYTIRFIPPGGAEPFQEIRIDPRTKAPVRPPESAEFLVVSNFFKLLNYLHPQFQGQSRFRYLGRSNSGGQDLFVVAFAQRPDGIGIHSNIQTGADGETAPMQGLVWIDASSKRIVRLRLDLLGPIDGFPLETLTTDIALAPVNFTSSENKYWLPARVTVHARFLGGELHSVHRYSDYRSANGTGEAAAVSSGEDAYEMLARGIGLLEASKSTDAIVALRAALVLNPQNPSAHFNLANALLASGDAAGTEAELRDAAKLIPESGALHNFLGIVLGKRGDVAGAVAEFRKSAQIQPKEPNVRFNLAQALEKSGDRAEALAEYRAASELAPDNVTFKTRYEQFGVTAKVSPSSETTIKVDVRQVLVPVIVTDKEGHHVTGLTQTDFRVFEEGVEQKISAFSVENAGQNGDQPVSAGIRSEPEHSAAQTPSATAKPAPVRRTYVICIDSLHSSAANLVSFRTALVNLFRSERAGDSQYAVLAIGTSTQLVQNTTSDPEQVTKAIESKDFQRMFLAGRKIDILAFRRRLDDVRAECDSGQPGCASDKRQLAAEASGIASEDRGYNMAFLGELKSAVQQIARGTERRTIVLVSDGFQMVPGKEALDLLIAYFPELRSTAHPSFERMQELDPILHLAANSNIPIYTIDSRGLYPSPFFQASNPGGSPRLMPEVSRIMSAAASESGDTLSEIAAATGGTWFKNNNNILTGLQRAFADGRQYYMLAYVPSNTAPDGRFRAISVRLRDGKMVVKAKRGYWAGAN